jgi:hypothetical protein
MNLKLQLITGDINQIESLDFLLLGHKNPLCEQIRKETSSDFRVRDSESWMFPHQYKFLEAPSYKWKKVAAIKFRANGKISETQFVRISSPIATALKQQNIRSIGILPPTWRNPSYCALGIIYAIWINGYAAAFGARSSYPEAMKEIYPSPAGVAFKIISQVGTAEFENVLKDDCELMWRFLKRLLKQQSESPWTHQYKSFRRISVKFDVTKIQI